MRSENSIGSAPTHSSNSITAASEKANVKKP